MQTGEIKAEPPFQELSDRKLTSALLWLYLVITMQCSAYTWSSAVLACRKQRLLLFLHSTKQRLLRMIVASKWAPKVQI